MQDIWEKLKENLEYQEKHQVGLRVYIRAAWYVIHSGLAMERATCKTFPKKLVDDVMRAKGRELWHPRFDCFFSQLSADDVYTPDFFNAYFKARELFKSGRIPFDIKLTSVCDSRLFDREKYPKEVERLIKEKNEA